MIYGNEPILLNDLFDALRVNNDEFFLNLLAENDNYLSDYILCLDDSVLQDNYRKLFYECIATDLLFKQLIFQVIAKYPRETL